MSQPTAVPTTVEQPMPAALAASTRRSVGRGQARTALLMIAPALLLVALFTLYPFGQAIYESTRISSPIFPPEFVGLQNYRDVIGSGYFADAALTTLAFTAVVTPLLVVLGILVALLLDQPFWGNSALRAGMLLPWAIPASAAGVIWQWVFLDSWGALNAGLYSLGIIGDYIEWLTTPNLARFAVIVVFVWTQLPLAALLVLAALQAIPRELHEAAALDGASTFGRFWSITLPGIRPMVVVVALYEALMAITNFDITYALTHGGPGSATTMLTYFTWAESFKMLDFGQGAALALVIAVGSLLLIVALLRALPRGAILEEAR
ncbi:MAG TPA: sugar ABC transporter permease [Thermomicrobiales bacterium]|nr:sugar ABC transporter permease [Thermomicrobiales bacterium]